MLLQILNVAPILYAPGTCFTKLSLLLFYLRISPATWFRWTTKALILVVAGYSTGITLSYIFACSPIEATWDVAITQKTCIHLPALYIVTAVLGVATDIVLLVLPLSVVLDLQMSTRRKVELVFIFGIGSL